MTIKRGAVRLVDACRRHAGAVALAALVLTLAFGFYVATHLTIDTDQEQLISQDLPWRQTEMELDRLFPQNSDVLLVVVDGPTPLLADAAAGDLAARLQARPDLFKSVRRPDALPFFKRNGLLFLPIDELRSLTERLIEAQPLIGALAADPSLRGLLGALDLAFEGVERGDAALADLAPAMATVAAAAESVAAGQPRPAAWQTLLTGRAVEPSDLRSFIVTQPVLDYGALESGAVPSDFVRASAAALGLSADHGYRVRLTGSVPLADEEFATVGQGTELAFLVSFLLVALELFLALRSPRLIAAILLTLIVGLVLTATFATVALGSLNLISVAFAVLFVGLAVDFGIQFSVRFREEHFHYDDVAEALRRCAAGIGGPLLLAAATTMVGFFSFVPTAYVGVSELGIIAGVGMIIAVALNMTLLPALLTLFRPPGERSAAGYAWMAGPDRFLAGQARWVLLALLALVVVSAVLALRLTFDFNPLNLKDQRTESVSTLLDLINDPTSTPYTAKVLAPSMAAADALSAKLEALPEVSRVVTAASFVPTDQEEKLAVIGDAAMLLAPSLTPPMVAPPPDAAANEAALRQTVERLNGLDALETETAGGAAADAAAAATAKRLSAALEAVLAAGPAAVQTLGDTLVAGATKQIADLAALLQAQPVTLADVPAELMDDWVTKDGRVVIKVVPKGDVRDNATLVRFVDALQAVAPGVSGMPVSIQASGHTVVSAFMTAGVLALAAIMLLLGAIFRRVVDVLLVLVPTLIGGLFTMATCVLIGLPMTFANIIVLPLLLGIGVAYGVYYVMNWRAGVTEPLQSSMTRAVMFSALTTGTSFGSLALSGHPGTAGMGLLLVISLTFTVIASLVFLPAALAFISARKQRRLQPR